MACKPNNYIIHYPVGNSNWTKFECEKHAKLVNELKERKAKGETNLIIRNDYMYNI